MSRNQRGAAPVSAEQRREMIAEAAYFRAEHNGFSGDALRNWLEAEAEIDRLLREGGGSDEEHKKFQFREKFEQHLSEWDDKFEELKLTAKEVGEKLREELDPQWTRLGELRAIAQKQVLALREHGADAWEEMRSNADRAAEEMRDSLSKLAAKLNASKKRVSSSATRKR